MNSAIWVDQLFDAEGHLLIGGVQTYVFELAQVIIEAGMDVRMITPGKRPFSGMIHGIPVEAILAQHWKAGITSPVARRLWLQHDACLHIAANAHFAPLRLGPWSIGIQHGIYWDRPAVQVPLLLKPFPRLVNLIRSWRGASAVTRFSHLVCVDLAYPTMAACVYSPLPWDCIHYIPNFAPETVDPPVITSTIRRIVFPRRLEPHRGTRLFAQAVLPLLREGWDGEIHVIGKGPDEAYLRENLGGFACVRFQQLPFERRMEAYAEDSLVLIPSLSTEGTSLACIEAWSRGAVVLCTCVGGLANLVVPGVNGLLVRPLARDVTAAIRAVIGGQLDVQRLKRNGLESYQVAYCRSVWRDRWLRVLAESRGECGGTDAFRPALSIQNAAV